MATHSDQIEPTQALQGEDGGASPSELPRTFRYPQKAAPGRYEVTIWAVPHDRVVVRFKTERDALRFFQAAERGEAVSR